MTRVHWLEEMRRRRRLQILANNRGLAWANRVIDAAKNRGDATRVDDLEEALRIAISLLDGQQLQQHMRILGPLVRDWS